MLVADPEIAWLDRRHLRNWWRLALPPGIDGNSHFALLVLQQGSLVHAIRSGQGVVHLCDVPFTGTGPRQLARLREALKVEGLLVLEQEALADAFEAMERGLKIHDDYVTQGVGLWQCLRARRGIYCDPPLLELIPPLKAPALQKTFDFLVPNESSMAAYVINEEERKVHSSVLAMKQKGQISLVAMHPAIRDLVSEQEILRDWRQNYKRVNQALSSRFAKPSISVFVERKAIDRILSGPADQLTRELRAKQVIVDPAPLWLQGLLGGATAAAVATQNAKRVARFLPKGARRMAGDLATVAQDRIKNAQAGPFASLGFDPLALWQELRSYYVVAPPSSSSSMR